MILNTLTFELRIFLRKKRARLEQHKKGIKRILKFIIPSQEAKGGQPLAPILGQVQINTFDFCTTFNTKTKDYPKGLLIYVELIVNWDKTYILNLRPFLFTLILQHYFYIPIINLNLKIDYNYCISLLDFYKLIKIYQQLTGLVDIKKCVKSVYSTLLSYKICITFYTEFQLLDICNYIFSSLLNYYFLIEQNIKGFGLYNYYIQFSLSLLDSEFINNEINTNTIEEND